MKLLSLINLLKLGLSGWAGVRSGGHPQSHSRQHEQIKGSSDGKRGANNLMMEVGPRARRILIDDPRKKDSWEFRVRADRRVAEVPSSCCSCKWLGLILQQ